VAGNCGHKFVVDGIDSDRSLSVYPGVAPVRHMYVVRGSTRIFIFIFFYYHGITRVPVLCIPTLPRPVTVPVFIDEGIFFFKIIIIY